MDKQAYEGWKKTVIASNKQTKAKGLEAFPCFISFFTRNQCTLRFEIEPNYVFLLFSVLRKRTTQTSLSNFLKETPDPDAQKVEAVQDTSFSFCKKKEKESIVQVICAGNVKKKKL